MKFTYDLKHRAAYLVLRHTKPGSDIGSEEVVPGLVLDRDDAERLVGIEILDPLFSRFLFGLNLFAIAALVAGVWLVFWR